MDTLFFWFSKVAWLIIKPDTILLILTIAVLFFLWRKSYDIAKNLLTLIILGMLIIAFIPVGSILLNPLETRFKTNPVLPKNIDGIIVLSGAVDVKKSRLWNQTQFGNAAERYMMFLKLAKEYPQSKLVFTGGTGSLLSQQYKEADEAELFFNAHGLNISRVIFERESRNTYENTIFSKKLVQPSTGENWVLITTAWHMPRSVGIFCKQAWSVIPYPVDHLSKPNGNLYLEFDFSEHLLDLSIAIKEWIGLTAYYLTGKTSSLFPQSCL